GWPSAVLRGSHRSADSCASGCPQAASVMAAAAAATTERHAYIETLPVTVVIVRVPARRGTTATVRKGAVPSRSPRGCTAIARGTSTRTEANTERRLAGMGVASVSDHDRRIYGSSQTPERHGEARRPCKDSRRPRHG